MNKKRTVVLGGVMTIAAAANLVLAFPGLQVSRATTAIPGVTASITAVSDPQAPEAESAAPSPNAAVETPEDNQTSTGATQPTSRPQNPPNVAQEQSGGATADTPAIPKQVGKELQLRDRPGNDAMVDAYCVLSFDDGTTTETYVGGKPKAIQHGVDVQFDC